MKFSQPFNAAKRKKSFHLHNPAQPPCHTNPWTRQRACEKTKGISTSSTMNSCLVDYVYTLTAKLGLEWSWLSVFLHLLKGLNLAKSLFILTFQLLKRHINSLSLCALYCQLWFRISQFYVVGLVLCIQHFRNVFNKLNQAKTHSSLVCCTCPL